MSVLTGSGRDPAVDAHLQHIAPLDTYLSEAVTALSTTLPESRLSVLRPVPILSISARQDEQVVDEDRPTDGRHEALPPTIQTAA